jgi:two-component system response regulator RegA
LLIVDDDSAARESLAQWFRDARWNVRTATGCSNALAMVAAASPAALLLEQRFADGSAFDLLARLRATNPAMVAVVLTRTPSIAAAVHAIRIGFRDYLAKPIDPRRLESLISSYVGGESPAATAANDVGDLQDEPASLARVEWEHIHTVLLDCRGNISEAARVLGLHRRSLQRKLRRTRPVRALVSGVGRSSSGP